MKEEKKSHKAIWKTVKQVPIWEINRFGTIRLKDTKVVKRLVLHNGYLAVIHGLSKKNKKYKVHRLVAENFLIKPNKKNIEVNHKDGNKFNNHKSNLEWISPADNVKHYFLKISRGHGYKPLTLSQLIKIYKLKRFKRRHGKTKQYAERYKCSTQTIRRIWTGKFGGIDLKRIKL